MSSAVWFLCLQMYSKTAQDARQFFVRRFWGPFGFQMHLLGIKLDPFRTLKKQWGTCVLRRLVFRPSNVFENSTGCSPIFFRRFFAPLGFQMHLSGCELDPFRTLKVQWGHPVSFTAGVGSRSVRYRLIFVLKQHRTPAKFLVRRFWVILGSKCTF